eukprot:TRINITY_DN14275_c0_g1_i1.p1 TRINITY_DN14275_c0_g1~~TRINITY_DN14275_c0_g1_i1.p1  ORF type:complete len:364 (-),score=87.76 TRINITY_DN14275_c0_g1_i1:193-1284(-)
MHANGCVESGVTHIHGSDGSVYVGMALYVLSGVCQPILVDALKYEGFMGGKDASRPSTHIGVLLNMIGMVFIGMVYLVRHPWPRLTRGQYRNMAVVCLLDLLSQALVMYGQLKVGGGLYVVLYSSCTVWTAVLSRLLLGKVLHRQQWIGVAEVTGGLILSKVSLLAPSDVGRVFAADVFAGGLVLLGGAVLHSLTAVAMERLLVGRPGEQRIAPMAFAGWLGLVSTAVLVGYNAWLARAAGFRHLFIDPVAEAGGSWETLARGVPALVLANAIHAGAFFYVVSSNGAVSAGIMKGTQAFAVFVINATLFCSLDATQCVTVYRDGALYSPGLLKVFAMGLVVHGILQHAAAPEPSPTKVDSKSD